MIGKKELSEALALSCVEKYFLAWLKSEYDVSSLYGYSFVEIKRVLEDFAKGARYEDYRSVPRLQDTAEDFGITGHSYFPAPQGAPCSPETALQFVRQQGSADLCLIRVNAAYSARFKRSAWRSDHYICVDAQLNWANEYPLSEGRFTKAEFMQSFGGAICLYKLKDTQKRSGSDCEKRIKEQDFFDIRPGIGIKKFEDAVGILRVTRRRMAEYFRAEGKLCELWQEECGLLDKLYFDVRMQELRQGGNESELYRKINEIILSERKIAEEMK